MLNSLCVQDQSVLDAEDHQMTNKFKKDDVVSHIMRGRHHGIVQYILCGDCVSCKAKQFDSCAAVEKNKVIVRWETGNTAKPYIKFRYSCDELEWTSIAFKPTGPRKTINGIKPHKGSILDIRKLASMTVDVPSVDTEEVMSITEKAPSSKVLTGSPYEDDDDDEYHQWTQGFRSVN